MGDAVDTVGESDIDTERSASHDDHSQSVSTRTPVVCALDERSVGELAAACVRRIARHTGPSGAQSSTPTSRGRDVPTVERRPSPQRSNGRADQDWGAGEPNLGEHLATPALRAAAGAAPVVESQLASVNGDGVVQRKKTQPDGPEVWKRKYLVTFEGRMIYNFGDAQDVQNQSVFAHMADQYAKASLKGMTMWGRLQTALARYAADRPALQDELREKRAEYDRIWEANYESTYRAKPEKGAGVYEAQTLGSNPDGPTERERQVDYLDTLDPQRNTIQAEAIYANTDPARKAGAGLPSSEILWRQYFEAAKRQFWFWRTSRAEQKMQLLEHLVQHQAVNDFTQQVVYFSYPDGRWWDHRRDWDPRAEEFYAILGTPNLASAAWMLIDHVDELGGKTIQSIVTTADQDIDTTFEDEPGLDDIGPLDDDVMAADAAIDQVATADL